MPKDCLWSAPKKKKVINKLQVNLDCKRFIIWYGYLDVIFFLYKHISMLLSYSEFICFSLYLDDSLNGSLRVWSPRLRWIKISCFLIVIVSKRVSKNLNGGFQSLWKGEKKLVGDCEVLFLKYIKWHKLVGMKGFIH